MYVEGDLPVVTTGNNNGFGFGGGWEGLIGLALVAGLFGNGWGFGGFGGGRGGNCATQADLSAGFANSEIMSDLNSIINSQTQGFAGLNTVISNATSTLGYNMLQGFHGVDNAICTLGYQQAQSFNTLGHQISDCCCATQRAIDGINYNLAKSTCDIIQAGHSDTDRILNYLTSEKISALQAENSGLKAQISNDRQSAYIIGALTPKCPEPAYIVPNPNCCYNACGSIQ
jgi:hypothetical protein